MSTFSAYKTTFTRFMSALETPRTTGPRGYPPATGLWFTVGKKAIVDLYPLFVSIAITILKTLVGVSSS